MIAKSIVAGTVLSLMAGGVVYFGTEVEAENAAAEHPHTQKTPAETKIKAKKVVIEKAEPKKVKKAETKAEPEPKKKWLDTYLKKESSEKEAPKKEAASDKDTGKFVIKKDKPAKLEKLTEDDIEKAEKDGFEDRMAEVENVWVEKGEKTESRVLKDILKGKTSVFVGEGKGEKTVDVQVLKDEDGETRIETETIDMGDGKKMKIVKKTRIATADIEGEIDIDIEDMIGESLDLGDGKKMRVKILTDKDIEGGMETLTLGDGKTIKIIKNLASNEKELEAFLKPKTLIFEDVDISETVKTVMEQAKKIKMPELRDRAYLDLVSYALDHGDYKVADKALAKIEQVELRDTARNRMAIAYAQAGNSEDAFAVLEDIEVDALRDVMRLQVIEAMIAPEELPKDMQ